MPIPNPASDVSVRTVYDGLNRAIYSIDGVGAVVARSYDDAGNLLQRTAYATAVPVGTAATAAALSAAVALVANASRDALERNTYDAAGRRTWTVDGTGAVTQPARCLPPPATARRCSRTTPRIAPCSRSTRCGA